MEGKYWCFTLNNYSEQDIEKIKLKENKYLVFGYEIGDSGTPHLQGYIEFETNHKLPRLKKDLGDKIHWERRKGTAAEASTYCKKDGNFEEYGEISKARQGKRTDIDNVRELVNSGGGMSEIMEITSSFQAVRFGELLLKYKEPSRNWQPKVKWIWGPTGVGKTKMAFEEATNPYISGKNLKWWEGYDAHKHVIIDDFRKDFCTFHELLRILDRYPYRIEVKGSSRQFLATDIWITSCYPPEEVYDTREDVEQLLRRISEIIQI